MRTILKVPVEVWGGMECSVNRVQDEYFDQLSYSGHRNRRGDLELFASLGIKKMRYPLLWEHHKPSRKDAANWEGMGLKLGTLRDSNVDVIAGLVHHGSGPSYVNIMEENFVHGLAQYASSVAKRFPWIEYYTPVNEPLTTARFCGLYGLWFPHEKNDAAFCRILINECMATAMAMAEIRKINPAAKLVQTEDMGKVHSTPALQYQADFENHRRWLSYDLLCGKVGRSHRLCKYLLANGIAANELEYFLRRPCPPDILGINYYMTSERYLDDDKALYPVHTHGGNGKASYADVEVVRVGKARQDGLKSLLNEAWARYRIPIAVTEVQLHCTREEQMRWLKEVWETANELKRTGISIVAITPWALLGAFGWDRLLTRAGGTYEAGVFDISSGDPRPTILADMIKAYARNQRFDHPVLHSPGWWKRTCRAIYGEDECLCPVKPSGELLLISGTHSAALAEVCRRRCLNVAEKNAMNFNRRGVWASIAVNDYMEIICDGRPSLVIPLDDGDELYNQLNNGLNLFLDGESGWWDISPNGNPYKIHTERARLSPY